jgi:hypothetical protein
MAARSACCNLADKRFGAKNTGSAAMASKVVRFLSWVMLSAILGGCSQALIIEKGQLAKAEEVQCTRVTRTGSHMSKRVCTTRSQREAQSLRAQSALERASEQQRVEQMARRAARQR